MQNRNNKTGTPKHRNFYTLNSQIYCLLVSPWESIPHCETPGFPTRWRSRSTRSISCHSGTTQPDPWWARAILKYILDGSLHLFSQFAQCRVTLTQSIHSFKNLESRLLGINSCQLWKDAEEDAQGLFLICERNIPCQPFRGLSATHVFAQRMPIRWF